MDTLRTQVEAIDTECSAKLPQLSDPSTLSQPLDDAQHEVLKTALGKLFKIEREALQTAQPPEKLMEKIQFLTYLRGVRAPYRLLLFKNGELLISRSDSVLASVQSQAQKASETLTRIASDAEAAVNEASTATGAVGSTSSS